MKRISLIFLALIVTCLSLIPDVFTKNIPDSVVQQLENSEQEVKLLITFSTEIFSLYRLLYLSHAKILPNQCKNCVNEICC